MLKITDQSIPRPTVASAESESSVPPASGNSKAERSSTLEGLPARNADHVGVSRRSASAPRRLAHYDGSSIPAETDKRLTALYGATARARAKEGSLPVQKTEFDPADSKKPKDKQRARVNPTRMWVTKAAEAPGMTPVVKIQTQSAMAAGFTPRKCSLPLDLAALEEGKITYKWDISANGTLIVGESKPIDPNSKPGEPKRIKMGHTTLVGGHVVPMARFGGVLRFDAELKTLVIDNDSGRFSEREELTPDHLRNVALAFKEAGIEVGTQWKNMVAKADGEQQGA